MMRFVLCLLLATMLPAAAVAAEKTMSLTQAQAAADKGDADASAALAVTTDHDTCINECGNRGYDKAHCAHACRPGLCHVGGDQPYCVAQ